jgi:protein-tyrosine-phosphatase
LHVAKTIKKLGGCRMNILFVCTDNYTRSVIAEFCLRDYLKETNNTAITVASAGIRANSDISKYSGIHFSIMNEMGNDTSSFTRWPTSSAFC